MTTTPEHDEERIAELLRALPAPPDAWVEAAKQLPLARAEIERIAARAEADEEFRAAVTADLEAALAAAGYELDPTLIPALRERLSA
jgi:hypothetical protein